LAYILKNTGSVFADYVEMQNIKALGNAVFDAGYWSIDINNSNPGWVFHASPLNYKLPADTAMLAGDSIVICADNFNGNVTSTYMWQDSSGVFLSDSNCLVVSKKGVYILTVFYGDGPGCSRQDTIDVSCFLELSVIPTDISCYNFSDGRVELTPVVGTAPYSIKWFDYQNNLIGDSLVLEDVPAGIYHFNTLDAKGCITKDSLILTQPDTLELNHEITNACFQMMNGFISLNSSGGTQPYHYIWNDGNTNSERTGLAPGIYSVSMTDAYCPAVDLNLEIIELADLDYDFEAYDLNCYHDSSGSISVKNMTGGNGLYTEFVWQKDDEEFEKTLDIDSLMSGEYTLTAYDDIGCLKTKSIVIAEPDEIVLEMDTVGFGWLGGVDLTVTGGNEPYYYEWNNGETTEDIDELEGGFYTVEVEDAQGCNSEKGIFVEVHSRIYAPTGFSPNGDNMNDEFKFINMGTDLKSFDLAIYNRWGQTVFTSNNANFAWNGRLNNAGEVLSIGVYTWKASLVFTNDNKATEKGNITLIK
jgi:gliding motility-associated-like protein